jgi:phosphopantetheinyl transferase
MMRRQSSDLNIVLPQHMEPDPLVCRNIEILAPTGSTRTPRARLLIAKFQHLDPSRQETQTGCRYLLNKMLASTLPELNTSWESSYAPSGAPRLTCNGRPSTINISFAHSGKWLAVGLSYKDKIGVDIEQIKSRRNGPAIAKFLGWKGGVRGPNDFYAKWALWEAGAKCIESSALAKQNLGFDQLERAGSPSQLVTSGLWASMHDCFEGKACYAIVLKCKEKTDLAERNIPDVEVAL